MEHTVNTVCCFGKKNSNLLKIKDLDIEVSHSCDYLWVNLGSEKADVSIGECKETFEVRNTFELHKVRGP